MNRLASGLAIAALLAAGCDHPTNERTDGAGAEPAAVAADTALSAAMRAARTAADDVVDALRPEPLMTGADEAALRRYDNDAHLARARALGVRPADDAERERLAAEGRLVALDDSAEFYVHEVEDDGAWVVPATKGLIDEIGYRFQRRLLSLGLPQYRIIISSALRTAADQAELRATNSNAAAGTSTHEFGTTVDILYEAFAAPRDLPAAYVVAEPGWLREPSEVAARAMLEAAAARKSRELMAILGEVLREMQGEGAVYVTLERQQPVFHVTVAR